MGGHFWGNLKSLMGRLYKAIVIIHFCRSTSGKMRSDGIVCQYVAVVSSHKKFRKIFLLWKSRHNIICLYTSDKHIDFSEVMAMDVMSVKEVTVRWNLSER